MSQFNSQQEFPLDGAVQQRAPNTSDESLAVRENLYFAVSASPDPDTADGADLDLEEFFTSLEDENNASDDAESEVSVEDEGAGPASTTPRHIAELVRLLDSAVYTNRGERTRPPGREDAYRLLIAMGPTALPQLAQAYINPASAEQGRRAELAIDRITRRMTANQLLDLRNPEVSAQLINQNVAGPLDQATRHRVGSELARASVNAMGEHLTAPDWVQSMRSGRKGKYTDNLNPPTEASVRNWDSMDRPEGQALAAERLEQLSRMMRSGRLTTEERQTISNQIVELGTFMNPETIRWGRANSRAGLAETLHRTNPGANAARVQDLLLDAHQMVPQDQRYAIHMSIIQLGLDQNAGFMQAFERRAGRDSVVALEMQREIMKPRNAGANK